jgi:hypothetical protein
VTGNGPFAYRWRKNGVDLHDGAHISGATTWILTLANVSPFDAASYDVVVTGFTSVTSNAATLTVNAQPEQLLLYEPFDYANVGGLVTANTPSNWATNGAGGPDDMAVVAGSLSFPGLAAPVGNSAVAGARAGRAAARGCERQQRCRVFFRAVSDERHWHELERCVLAVGALTAPTT